MSFLTLNLPTVAALDDLLKLRLIVARCGEMDLCKWWNSKSQLGKLGTAAVRRGLPRTHRFAQARSVFAIAANRCADVFDPPNCVTLWRLPESIEEEFDARWETWLDCASEWIAVFEKLETVRSPDLISTLKEFELVSVADLANYERLRTSAEGRAVAIPGSFSGTKEDFSLLALSFAKGEIGALAVPYMQRAAD